MKILVGFLGVFSAVALGHPLKLHWSFEEQAAIDKSGNNARALLESVSFEVEAGDNTVANVLGRIALTEPQALDLGNSFSVAFWLKTHGDQQGLLSVTAQNNVSLSINKVGNRLTAQLNVPDFALSSESPLADNDWQHIAIVYHKTLACRNIDIYVNGVSAAQKVGDKCFSGPFGVTHFEIQGSPEGTLFDDVRFYQLALTNDEVSCLMNRKEVCVMASQRGAQGSSGEEALKDLSVPQGGTGSSIDGDQGVVPGDASIVDRNLSIGGKPMGQVTGDPLAIPARRGADGVSVTSTQLDTTGGGSVTFNLTGENNQRTVSSVKGRNGTAKYTYNGTDITDHDDRRDTARGVNGKVITDVGLTDGGQNLAIRTAPHGNNDGIEQKLGVKGDTPERFIQGLTGIQYGANGRENYVTRAQLGDAPTGQSYLYYIPIMVGDIMVVLPPRADQDNLLLEFSNGDIVDAGDLKGHEGTTGASFDSLWSFSSALTTVEHGSTYTQNTGCEVFWNEIAPKGSTTSVNVSYSNSTISITPATYEVTTSHYVCAYCNYPIYDDRGRYTGCRRPYNEEGSYQTLAACQASFCARSGEPGYMEDAHCSHRSKNTTEKYKTTVAQFCAK